MLRACERAKAEGVSCEAIDLQTIAPWDMHTLRHSVQKTGEHKDRMVYEYHGIRAGLQEGGQAMSRCWGCEPGKANLLVKWLPGLCRKETGERTIVQARSPLSCEAHLPALSPVPLAQAVCWSRTRLRSPPALAPRLLPGFRRCDPG
jgi:hypothetical protein